MNELCISHTFIIACNLTVNKFNIKLCSMKFSLDQLVRKRFFATIFLFLLCARPRPNQVVHCFLHTLQTLNTLILKSLALIYFFFSGPWITWSWCFLKWPKPKIYENDYIYINIVTIRLNFFSSLHILLDSIECNGNIFGNKNSNGNIQMRGINEFVDKMYFFKTSFSWNLTGNVWTMTPTENWTKIHRS